MKINQIYHKIPFHFLKKIRGLDPSIKHVWKKNMSHLIEGFHCSLFSRLHHSGWLQVPWSSLKGEPSTIPRVKSADMWIFVSLPGRGCRCMTMT